MLTRIYKCMRKKKKKHSGNKSNHSYKVKSCLLELMIVCGHFFDSFFGVWILWGDGDEGVDQEAYREVNPDYEIILLCEMDFDKAFPRETRLPQKGRFVMSEQLIRDRRSRIWWTTPSNEGGSRGAVDAQQLTLFNIFLNDIKKLLFSLTCYWYFQ